MTLARKCDRCGALYIPETRNIDNETFNSIVPLDRNFNGTYFMRNFYDLCPDCLDSFLKWFNAED